MEADESASLSIEPAQQSYNSPVRQQEPTYSGADKDVVIIVSSDDDDDQPVQPSYQQVCICATMLSTGMCVYNKAVTISR